MLVRERKVFAGGEGAVRVSILNYIFDGVKKIIGYFGIVVHFICILYAKLPVNSVFLKVF